MGPREEDRESFELESRGNGSPAPSVDNVRSLSFSDEDDASEEGEELRAESLSYTPEEELSVKRSLDKRLVLLVAFLYMLSFLDRSNIGNAKIAGLETDLNLTASQYESLLSAFYYTYIAFQWMTLLYQIVTIHIYMTCCVLAWSILACLQSLSRSFLSMFILRALLGLAECTFSPGIPFLLSRYFRREELALRIGLLIAAAPLAASLASSLAWVITKAGEHTSIAAWRLLFLVEGAPTVFVAVVVWFQINPEKANYLNRREKKVVRLRLQAEKDAERSIGEKAGISEKSKLDYREIGQALKDVKCWITAVMLFSCNLAFSSLPPFLPTLIKDMNHSALVSQALSAPPYLCAFVGVLATAYLSDRSRNRSFYIILNALLSAFGYLFIAIAGAVKAEPKWRYAGIFPSAIGFFGCVALLLSWTLNNQNSESKRGTGVVMLNLLGQLGPLVGVRLYDIRDKPYYVRGNLVCGLFMLGVAMLALILRRILIKENERMSQQYQQIGAQGKKLFMNIL